MHAYGEAIKAGRLATARGFALAPDDRLRRAVIEKIMCDLKVDLDALMATYGAAPDHFSEELGRLEPFERDRLITRDGPVIEVTEQGRPLVRSVAGVFDRYLGKRPARHSQAV